jgi:hypothetical protein
MSVDANNTRAGQLTLTPKNGGVQPNSEHNEKVKVKDSSGQLDDAFDNVVTSASKTPTSSVSCKGVSYYKQSSKYQAYVNASVIGNNRKQLHLGFYWLQSNAALAHDRGAAEFKLQGGSIDQARNFKTTEEYTTAREQELKKRGIEKETVGSVNDIEAQINDLILALQQPKQTQKSSAYKGVSKSTGQTKYQAQIFHNKKQLNIGCYQLESDAAYAYDEAAKLLKGPSWKRNFKTKEDHTEAREIEIKQRGIDSDKVEIYECVFQQIKQHLNKMTVECNRNAQEDNDGALFLLFSPQPILNEYNLLCRTKSYS